MLSPLCVEHMRTDLSGHSRTDFFGGLYFHHGGVRQWLIQYYNINNIS